MKADMGYLSYNSVTEQFECKIGDIGLYYSDSTSANNIIDEDSIFTYTGIRRISEIEFEVEFLNTLIECKNIKIKKCKSCGRYFIYGENFEKKFQDLGFELPKRCFPCRKSRRLSN